MLHRILFFLMTILLPSEVEEVEEKEEDHKEKDRKTDETAKISPPTDRIHALKLELKTYLQHPPHIIRSWATMDVIYKNAQGISASCTFDYRGEEDSKVHIVCTTSNNELLWTRRKIHRNGAECIAFIMLKLQLQHLQRFIKKFDICLPHLIFFDFGIHSLENVEELRLINYALSHKILSKTGKKLRVLDLSSNDNAAIVKCEQLYQVQDRITALKLRVSLEQLKRFKASEVRINIGSLTEWDIHNFIRSWQNGSNENSFHIYQWLINNETFNMDILFELVGATEYDNSGWNQQEIKHDTRTDVIAELSYGPSAEPRERLLTFRITNLSPTNGPTLQEWVKNVLPTLRKRYS